MSRNLGIPFRRDKKKDFASAEGDELLAAKVTQVLATECATKSTSGELPWRMSLGTPLPLLKHRRNDAVFAELARVYVRDALKKWVPDAEVKRVTVDQDGPLLILRVRFRAASEPVKQREISVRLPNDVSL